jgi:hypothetical protein
LPASTSSRLKAPRAKAAGVPGVRPTLPVLPSEARRLALVVVPLDFWADALRLWECQSFGAEPAPLSRVEGYARVLPAGALPHLPNTPGIGHTREWNLLDRDRRQERLNTDRVAQAQCHRSTGATALKATF